MAEVCLTLHRVFTKGLISFEVPTDPELRDALVNVLLACHNKTNDFVQVTFKRPYKKRTTGKNSQNHHLNAHIMQICNETGNDYETVKYCVKMRAVENLNYPFETIGGYTVPKAERNCDTVECAKLIEASHILAAELNIILREEGE